jgi:DNA-binding NarL/FixJ family response regulator
MTTVLIVDDNDHFRCQVRDILTTGGFTVVGEAIDGMSALEAADTLAPDFVLLDIGLPDIDGIDVAHRLAARTAAPNVVLTSSREASAYGRRLTTSPVLGFLPKDELSAEALRLLMETAR